MTNNHSSSKYKSSIGLATEGAYFFIGAGTSAPFGFPLGSGLLESVKNDIRDLEFIHFVEASQSKSIDGLGYKLKKAWNLGSLSKLIYEQRIDFLRNAVDSAIASGESNFIQKYGAEFVVPWVDKLLSFIAAGAPDYESAYRRIGPVDFNGMHGLVFNTLNYDRVIECSIFNWLMKKFPASKECIERDCFSGALVRHHHGSLGNLAERPFGSRTKSRSRLEFWFEKSEDPRSWGISNGLIEARENLIIMGFGFHGEITRRFSIKAKHCRLFVTDYDQTCEKFIADFTLRLAPCSCWVETGSGCADAVVSQLIGCYSASSLVILKAVY